MRCAERPPKDDPFIELDGPPELQFVMDRPLWEPRAEVRLDFGPLEPGVVAPDDLGLSLLYQQFSVDEGLLRRQVETLLDSQPSCTLGEVLERYPAQQGLAEIIAYLAIAASDTRHLIDPTTRDAILLRAGDATPMRLLHVPRVTFRGGYAR